MNKILISVIACILLCCGISSISMAETKEKATRIIVAGDSNYPPYEFIDSDNVFKGFNVDCMNAISKKIGMDVEIIPMNWADAVEALKNGKVDAIQGMTLSLERESSFDFSKDLVVNSQAIFIKKSEIQILDKNDLSNKRIVYQNGDVSKSLIQDIVNAIPIEVPNQQTAISILMNGKADAFVGNRLTGLYYLQKSNYLSSIKIVGESMYEAPYCIAVKNGNAELLKKINQGIDQIKKDGTYDTIYKKWFGESFTDNSAFFKEMLLIAVASVVILFMVILLILFWNNSLKREVLKATRSIVDKNEELERISREKGLIIDSIGSGIIALDSSYYVTNSNEYARKLLGYVTLDNMKYMDINIYKILGDKPFENKDIDNNYNESIEWRTSSMGLRNLDVRVFPIIGPQNTEGFLLFLHDYTKEKKLQDIVKQKDKMHALGKLSSGIAHELRNPLTSIKAFIDLIPIKIDNPEFRNKIMDIVPTEISRLETLVSMLLDYSKPRDSAMERIDFNKILDQLMPLIKVNLVNKKIIMTRPENTVYFLADPSQIKQIVINLVVNSIEAIDLNGNISIYAEEKKDGVEIVFEDDGKGIDEASIDKIFEPFFTLKQKGYGIGLAITQQLVTENRGTIEVESELAKGTRFTLKFQKA